LLSGLVFSLNSSSYLQPVFAGGNNENNNNKNGEDETTTESTTSETELRTAMRELWVDHVVYTRQFIADTVHDLPSLDQTTQRLLENQENIGDAIKPFYGEQAGDQLTNLLKEHILIAADVLSAAKKAGDDEALADAQQRWSDNADEIAAFLADANPNWDEDELSDMLHEHLSLTTDDAVARLQGDYQADIEAFDKVVDQAMEMADTLSDGIIAQFPEKFDD
jgi:hypothetical protein